MFFFRCAPCCITTCLIDPVVGRVLISHIRICCTNSRVRGFITFFRASSFASNDDIMIVRTSTVKWHIIHSSLFKLLFWCGAAVSWEEINFCTTLYVHQRRKWSLRLYLQLLLFAQMRTIHLNATNCTVWISHSYMSRVCTKEKSVSQQKPFLISTTLNQNQLL